MKIKIKKNKTFIEYNKVMDIRKRKLSFFLKANEEKNLFYLS